MKLTFEYTDALTSVKNSIEVNMGDYIEFSPERCRKNCTMGVVAGLPKERIVTAFRKDWQDLYGEVPFKITEDILQDDILLTYLSKMGDVYNKEGKKNYKVVIDEKCTVWCRTIVDVEASSEEEARKIGLKKAPEEGWDFLPDTMEYLSHKENVAIAHCDELLSDGELATYSEDNFLDVIEITVE